MRGSARKRPHILVAGLGNVLLQDDGVGIHVVRALQQDAPPGVCVAEVGTAVLDALHLFEWADYILAIDAMQAGGTPGAIYRFGTHQVQQGGIQTSLHELSLVSALRFIPEAVNPEITIIGVEPECIDYNLELSPSVARAVPFVVQAIREITMAWQLPAVRVATVKGTHYVRTR